MEDLIRKSEVMNRLKLLRYETEMNHRAPNTRRVMRLGCIDEVIEMVEEISDFQHAMAQDEKMETETQENMEDQETETEEIEVPKYPKNRILEPIMCGSTIGIDRFRCSKCGTSVRKEDRYCRSCGAMFGEIEDWKNTKWDTIKDCPSGREVS